MNRLGAQHAIAAAIITAALGLGACGGDDTDDAGGSDLSAAAEALAAADPSKGEFPDAKGKTLRELAAEGRAGLNFAPATATYTVGANRVAFGLLDQANAFVYAPSAIYVGRTPGSPARGPFLAEPDSLVTAPAYRSKNAALEDDPVASVYSTEVELPKPGAWDVLILSDTSSGLVGATAQLEVERDAAIPAVGEQAPEVTTDTVAKAGSIEEIDTRVPPDSMHEVDFADVAGDRPVALLFSTPQLCQSRVCGPVTDIAEQLKTTYGDAMEFIHQEVYVDNDARKGLRAPLEEFNLHSEPWLFTIDAGGDVAARLEGSFGTQEFEDAVQAALG